MGKQKPRMMRMCRAADHDEGEAIEVSDEAFRPICKDKSAAAP
jgi:hypothetical protein